jgi:lysophospholipase L1-like esterase
MIHRAVLIPCNAHLGQSDAAARKLCAKIGVVVAFLFLSGCEAIHVPDPNVIYVAFGDSSTSGPSTRDYPDILQSLLGVTPETVANEGESGETSEEGLDRLKGLLAGEIFPNAEVLLYWQGGNDISGYIKDHDPFLLASPDDPDYPLSNDLTQRLAETQANIESAVAAARNAGLRVYAATYFLLLEDIAGCDALPLDVVLPAQARNANVYIARLNERIRAAAANQGAVLVDVAAADDILRQDQANYFDCDHLSEKGNGIVANLFFQSIVGPTN